MHGTYNVKFIPCVSYCCVLLGLVSSTASTAHYSTNLYYFISSLNQLSIQRFSLFLAVFVYVICVVFYASFLIGRRDVKLAH